MGTKTPGLRRLLQRWKMQWISKIYCSTHSLQTEIKLKSARKSFCSINLLADHFKNTYDFNVNISFNFSWWMKHETLQVMNSTQSTLAWNTNSADRKRHKKRLLAFFDNYFGLLKTQSLWTTEGTRRGVLSFLTIFWFAWNENSGDNKKAQEEVIIFFDSE